MGHVEGKDIDIVSTVTCIIPMRMSPPPCLKLNKGIVYTPCCNESAYITRRMSSIICLSLLGTKFCAIFLTLVMKYWINIDVFTIATSITTSIIVITIEVINIIIKFFIRFHLDFFTSPILHCCIKQLENTIPGGKVLEVESFIFETAHNTVPSHGKFSGAIFHFGDCS